MSTTEEGTNSPVSSALDSVLRWSWRRHLAVLREDALAHPLGPVELDRRIAMGALDLAAGEALAAHASSREGRRRAAEALTGGLILALLSPRGVVEPAALKHLELARQGFKERGVAWGGLLRFADRARHPDASPVERAAAGAARWASHLALGDPAAECGRLAFAALAQAFDPQHATEPLAIALAHLERNLDGRTIDATAILAQIAQDRGAGEG